MTKDSKWKRGRMDYHQETFDQGIAIFDERSTKKLSTG